MADKADVRLVRDTGAELTTLVPRIAESIGCTSAAYRDRGEVLGVRSFWISAASAFGYHGQGYGCRERIDYGIERQRREGGLGRAARLDQLDEPSLAADNEATGRAFREHTALGLGLDARFIDDAMARAHGNPASSTRDRVAVESILTGWLEDVERKA